MAFKFDWKRVLFTSALSALSLLLEELSSGHIAPTVDSPQKGDSTINAIGPDGWPEKSGLGKASEKELHL